VKKATKYEAGQEYEANEDEENLVKLFVKLLFLKRRFAETKIVCSTNPNFFPKELIVIKVEGHVI